MLTIWARSFLTATRQDHHDDLGWAVPDDWRRDPRISNAERRARND